jgi:plasmid replication initiation protein
MENKNLYQKKGEVRKHNSLIRCKNNLTVIQRKTFAYFLKICIDEVANHNQTQILEVSTIELKKFLRLEKSNNHQHLRKELEILQTKLIQWDLRPNGKGKSSTMLSYFDLDDGIIRFEFSAGLKEKIFENGFTALKLQIITSFSSKYTIALYELLYQWKIREWVEFNIEEFKELMGVADDKAYNNNKNSMYNLRARVLSPALNEINNKSDLKVNCVDIKKGVKIVKFRFEFMSLSAEQLKYRESLEEKIEEYQEKYKDKMGNKYRISEKWHTLTKDGLMYRGKSTQNLFDAINFLKGLRNSGVLKAEDIKEKK